jgi:hypothetical protein
MRIHIKLKEPKAAAVNVVLLGLCILVVIGR